jgi:triosephosphate isomerase
MLVINLKNYKTGKDVLDLVRKIEIYYGKAIVAVPFTELKEVVSNKSSPNLQIYAQHVDWQEPGRSTGFITPESAMSAGAIGTLLNHSEHKITLSAIRKTIKRCNEVGLKVIICTSSLKDVSQIKKLNPYAIAYEDKKLIATGKSITTYKTNDVKKFVELLKDSEIIPLCGAGITTGDDEIGRAHV